MADTPTVMVRQPYGRDGASSQKADVSTLFWRASRDFLPPLEDRRHNALFHEVAGLSAQSLDFSAIGKIHFSISMPLCLLDMRKPAMLS